MISVYTSAVVSEEDKSKVSFIYQSYYSFMAYTASRYLRETADIEDVVHDAILKIINILDRIDMHDTVKVKNLCGIIAKNTAIDKCRSKGRGTLDIESVFDIADEQEGPEDIVIGNDSLQALISAINSLGETYRDVLRLKYINELTEKEIATLLGLPQKTVNQRIFRGKQILRRTLMEENRA